MISQASEKTTAKALIRDALKAQSDETLRRVQRA